MEARAGVVIIVAARSSSRQAKDSIARAASDVWHRF
jgi:hypothetical protein